MTKRKFSTGLLSPARFSLGLMDPAGLAAEGNIVRGLKVFRAGTFKDSKGREATWTREMLALMVSNFETLRANGILPNVPVREDHTETMKDVVGWFHALYLDPSNPDMLLADVEFTEPEKLAKYQRGTYRSRSIEISSYEDNDGREYAPVVIGLAFVDLPAVEGLFRLSNNDNPPPAKDDKSSDGGAGASHNKEKSKMAKFKLNGQETEDEAQVQAHIAALETFRTEAEKTLAFKFKINGTETSDFTAVQAHCLTLETFRTEAIESGRASFVDQLATDGKIGNPMKESFKAMVATMNDAQFDAFKKTYEAAPKLPLFGQHQGGNANGDTDPVKAEIETLEEIIANHRRSGMADEAVQNTKSFKRLQAIKAGA